MAVEPLCFEIQESHQVALTLSLPASIVLLSAVLLQYPVRVGYVELVLSLPPNEPNNDARPVRFALVEGGFMIIDRRRLLAGSVAAGSLAAIPALAQPQIITNETVLLSRDGSKPRIVIAGGGWGGLTAARYLR